ncbi:sensor histidine kinase [Streptomyces sp. NTH33]|uniref:sensor histidine kinase n=1 Tax=Streptomyces sp. NTH33 TaxID=1735453 RepID=UPI0021AC4717|nr:histidine kinase [Streptomyces sp. NTH33]
MLSGAVFAPLIGLGSHRFGLAVGGVLAATTLVVPGLVGISKRQRERLLWALRERAAAAEAAHRLADSESRIHERSRIAAEMHDLVGHRLSLVSLHSGGLEMALQKESPELRDEASLVRQAAGEAMRELREVLGILGPLGRDTGAGALTDATGTRPDVEALAEESRRGGIPVDLTWDGPDLNERPAQVRRAVHRVVRESLTNVHRYATGAQVTVTVTHTDDRVDVLVRNEPPPVAPEAAAGLGSGRGLVGLQERVGLLGGTLEAGPTPAGGFAVTAGMPTRPNPGAVLSDAGASPAEAPAEAGSGRPAVVLRAVVSALAGILGLAGVGGLMLLGLVLVSSPQPDTPDVQEQPRIGMSREKVELAIFGDATEVRAAATGREPARPKSATSCIYPPVSDGEDFAPSSKASGTAKSAVRWPEEGAGHLRITRYCFRGDTLAAIDRFTVPVMSQASHESSHD